MAVEMTLDIEKLWGMERKLIESLAKDEATTGEVLSILSKMLKDVLDSVETDEALEDVVTYLTTPNDELPKHGEAEDDENQDEQKPTIN